MTLIEIKQLKKESHGFVKFSAKPQPARNEHFCFFRLYVARVSTQVKILITVCLVVFTLEMTEKLDTANKSRIKLKILVLFVFLVQ